MPTVLGGDLFPPIEVVDLDLVGYKGNGEFILLKACRGRNRNLPPEDEGGFGVPMCHKCTIRNGQKVNFDCETAVLIEIEEGWHYTLLSPGAALQPLPKNTFFEIGHVK